VTFDEYTTSLNAKLSNVKRLLLQLLWDSGESFPRDWVPSPNILAATGQKYFDRRIRELRDELGCQIETGSYSGEAAYRLVSSELGKANPRFYLTASQKRALFERDGNACQVCGRVVAPGARGLQADHRIPLTRSGSHNADNWQSLCNECNVAKRRACEGCEDDCSTCSWAFPDKSGSLALVRLPLELRRKLEAQNIVQSEQLETTIREALQEYLAHNERQDTTPD